MESNNSIEELIIRYLQNEIQEDELRVLDAWIHESDANKAHVLLSLRGLFDTRKEVAFLNHIPWSVVGSEWLESWMRSLAYL